MFASLVKHPFHFAYISQFALDFWIPAPYQWGMEVEFADGALSLIETDRAGETGLPVGVIKSARRKLTVIRAASDDRDLRNWKSLHYEKLKGDRDGQRSIRLNDQYRMVFTLDEKTRPPTVTILAVEDYH